MECNSFSKLIIVFTDKTFLNDLPSYCVACVPSCIVRNRSTISFPTFIPSYVCLLFNLLSFPPNSKFLRIIKREEKSESHSLLPAFIPLSESKAVSQSVLLKSIQSGQNIGITWPPIIQSNHLKPFHKSQ